METQDSGQLNSHCLQPSKAFGGRDISNGFQRFVSPLKQLRQCHVRSHDIPLFITLNLAVSATWLFQLWRDKHPCSRPHRSLVAPAMGI